MHAYKATTRTGHWKLCLVCNVDALFNFLLCIGFVKWKNQLQSLRNLDTSNVISSCKDKCALYCKIVQLEDYGRDVLCETFIRYHCNCGAVSLYHWHLEGTIDCPIFHFQNTFKEMLIFDCNVLSASWTIRPVSWHWATARIAESSG